jgi:lysophosphatidate acyltransferase
MSLLGLLVKPAAYVGVPLFILHKASEASPIARYYVRLGLYLSTLGLCSAWGVCVAVGMTLAGRQLDVNYVVARSFHALAGTALGIEFEVEGEENVENVGAAVLVGNHQSMLDILYLGRYVYKTDGYNRTSCRIHLHIGYSRSGRRSWARRSFSGHRSSAST